MTHFLSNDVNGINFKSLNDSGIFEFYTKNNYKKTLCYKKINFTHDWYFVNIIDISGTNEKIDNMMKNIVVIYLIFLIILFLATYVYQIKISDPLEFLINKIEEFKNNGNINKEDLKYIIIIREIDNLIDEYYKMSEEFRKTLNILDIANKNLDKTNEKTINAYNFFAEKLLEIVDKYDEDTGDHIQRVGIMSEFIAKKMNMDDKFIKTIRKFAPLHDLGKVAIPQKIIFKNGPLTVEEWKIMQQHTTEGANLLGDIREFKMARNICLYHHEKYNGTGYPSKLKGREIPIEACIVSLVDVYDALRAKRPYKEGFSHEKTMEIITKGDNRTDPSDFNPEVMKVFMENEKEFYELWEKNTNI